MGDALGHGDDGGINHALGSDGAKDGAYFLDHPFHAAAALAAGEGFEGLADDLQTVHVLLGPPKVMIQRATQARSARAFDHGGQSPRQLCLRAVQILQGEQEQVLHRNERHFSLL